jgi:hypothetical protein
LTLSRAGKLLSDGALTPYVQERLVQAQCAPLHFNQSHQSIYFLSSQL